MELSPLFFSSFLWSLRFQMVLLMIVDEMKWDPNGKLLLSGWGSSGFLLCEMGNDDDQLALMGNLDETGGSWQVLAKSETLGRASQCYLNWIQNFGIRAGENCSSPRHSLHVDPLLTHLPSGRPLSPQKLDPRHLVTKGNQGWPCDEQYHRPHACRKPVSKVKSLTSGFG